MRRSALVAAALAAILATPAFAAGAYVTRTVQDASGTHLQAYWDESGVGAGPFDPVFNLPSGVSAGGGGSGGTAADQTGSNATDGQATSTSNQHALAFSYIYNGTGWDRLRGVGGAATVVDSLTEAGIGTPSDTAAIVGGNGSTIAQLKQAVTQLSSAVTQLTTIVTNQNATNAGTSATKAQGVQGVSGGVALPISGAVNQGTPNTSANAWYMSLATAIPAGANQIGSVAQAGAPWAMNLTQVAGTSLGTPTAYGTAPTGNALAVNAAVTQSALPTGAATSANQPTNASQGSTTSGQTGSMAMAAAVSNAQALTAGQTYPLFLNLAGGLRVDGSGVNQPVTLPNSTNAIGAISATNLGFGLSAFSRVTSSAASTNLTNAKASNGRVYKILACNTTTTPYRIKLYNAASTGAVTVGTTTPMFARPVPAAAAAGGLVCVSYDVSDIGWYFSTGITYAMTQGAADTDTTALAAGQATDVSVEYQ